MPKLQEGKPNRKSTPKSAVGAVRPSFQSAFSKQSVWEQLKAVYDPEIAVNIVDLQLIYSCKITEDNGAHDIHIAMTMTAPGCGMSKVLKSNIEQRLSGLPTVRQVEVDVVFDPPWTIQSMSEATRLQLGLDY